MQRIIRRFCMGVGFAATTYLIALTIQFQKTMPTSCNTVSVLIIGGIIGLLSFIFKTDLSYLVALIIHFILTFILVLVMIWINHWSLNLTSILMIVSIYVIIWAVIRINQVNDVNKINKKLRDRKKQG
ncbi:DUF3021 domain-containing protein [Limosilactobacillus agrestis]|uniref:DUF3021 domain-containing protein n=1 Tax=Limosilactobacillus agrestis TaxID=2759748 RepID=A0A7W3UHK9_9LACO|nr:DUF3021 family protein [Limosilactobacillus agrestis]MBB1095604.1 DUF3021 family protein [Limosilactobacillus agrestis]MCD7130757.1 DUF3021 domain-containing protein [Limosilactobacillus agrestis]